MKRFILYLAAAISLFIVWLITGLNASYLGPTYFQVAALWHIALQPLWFLATWLASAYGLLWYWQRRSRLPTRPAHHHPQQSH